MELIVCDREFRRIGQVTGANSKIWHRKYYEAGDFELYLPANSENLNMYAVDNYIVRDDDDSVGIIEDINIVYDVNDEVDMMIVSGKFSESIYSRRIIWQQTTLDTTLENGLRTLITDNVINPREIKMQITKAPSSATARISDESTGITGASVNISRFEVRPSIGIDISESTGITGAIIDKDVFEAKVSKSGTYSFMYDGDSWTLDGSDVVLSEYGIEYTDTPVMADLIVVSYTAKMTTGEHNFSYKNITSTARTKRSDNSGITRSSINTTIFETKIKTTGNYKFSYLSNTSLASANKGSSSGITAASVNKTTFEKKITTTGNYSFKYSDDTWKYGTTNINLADYGLSYSGTPSSGDEIIVYYSRHTWKLNNSNVNIAEYGITYAGTPASGDIIVISYTAENTAWYYNENVVNLADYGISYTGTATNGDTIIVDYKEYTGIENAAIDKLKFQKRTGANREYIFTYDNRSWILDGLFVDLGSFGITYEGTPAKGNVIYVQSNAMTNRIIENVRLGQLKGYEETLKAQYTGDELGKVITETCTANGIGYKNILIENNFQFELYKGEDRSYNQSKNPYVVFSDEYDNLASSGYTKTTSSHKNTALVAGEGEGLLRTTKEVGNSNKGLDRREIYVDARDLSSNNEEIETWEYDLLLDERGTEELSAHLITEVFTGDVELTDRYKYKEEVDIGDICSIENKKWGVYSNSRVIGVIETDDENGETIVFEFGS